MNVWDAAITVLAAVAVWSVIRARSVVRQTTLTIAWGWSLAAAVVGLAVWLETACDGPLPLRERQAAWAAAIILACCPGIVVLGARQPTAQVWTVFIILPLTVVLAWPLMAQWIRGAERLQLQWASWAGFGLVLLMGLGNYVGTAQTGAALLLGAGLSSLLRAFGDQVPFSTLAELQRMGVGMTACGTIWLVRQFQSSTRAGGLDGVWSAFRNLYGTVWTRRLMDRINHTGQLENWTAQLQWDGIHWDQQPTADDRTRRQMEHTFRWILKRFVDPEWLDGRLRTESGESEDG